MSIIRAPRPTDHYLLLRNDVVRDERLSYRARGLLAAVLSRPDDWRTSARQLAREGPDGEHAILGALRELEDLGYLVRRRTRGKAGRWQHELIVYDHPGDAPPLPLEPASESGQNQAEKAAQPAPDYPGAVEPAPEEPAPENPRSLEQPITNNRNENGKDIAPRPTNPWWEGLREVMGHGPEIGEESLWGRFTSRVRQAGQPPEEFRVRAERLALQWGLAKLTVPSLERHWERFGAPIGAVAEYQEAAMQAEFAARAMSARLAAHDAQKRLDTPSGPPGAGEGAPA